MAKKKKSTDPVRASRDGHEYHEMWVVRKSLELLNPNSKLKCIAVEGLAPVDQKEAKSQEVEVADVTLYYGGNTFKTAKCVKVLQFKYSVAQMYTPVRVSDAKKTLTKFSETFKNHISRYGLSASEKLQFQFITNRPISNNLLKMLENLSRGAKNSGKYLSLEKQFKSAVKLDKANLKRFASICEFQSYTSQLSKSKNELENTIISLSATSDSVAFSRLGDLKDLVSDKAGTKGEHNNTIERADLFDALGIRDINDFLPCQELLSDWGETVIREQMESSIQTISKSKKPILVHALGGVGKTVFMKSLADAFRLNHEVVFYDCFGGGGYRSLEQARHQSKQGLVHIANTLSFSGLCDPILPHTPDEQALAKSFRQRLEQCVATLKRTNLNREIYIFIDAVDNAELIAKQNRESFFPKVILESLHDKPINGVTIICSCRTERKPNTYAGFAEIELAAFSRKESTEFISARIKNPSPLFLDSAYIRSGGNARVLEYFIENHGKVVQSNSKLELDDLLTKRIDGAIEKASQRGSTKNELSTFLSGLTVLAPPVSVEDYAFANQVNADAIRSMVSDLAPLVELSNFGVKFKDEPVETLIQKKYGSNNASLAKIAKNLMRVQDKSIFAASTLPGLLYKIEDEKALYDLAVDERMPEGAQSDVAKLKIKYNRLLMAAKYAAEKNNIDKLIGFLVDISSIAEFDQRGLRYLLKYPGLVAEMADGEAIRRIYESRTEWPGTRHSCLSIIHTLRGELEDSHEQTYLLHERINQYLSSQEKPRYESDARMGAADCVGEPLFFIAKKSPKNAALYFNRWKEWFSFDIGKELYRYLPLALSKNVISESDIKLFHKQLKSPGALLASLHFYKLSLEEKKEIFRRIATGLEQKKEEIEFPDTLTTKKDFIFQKSFLYAALDSFRCKDKKSATTILDTLGKGRPRAYAFKDSYYHNSFPVEFLLREVIRSIIKGKEISFLDILPVDLLSFVEKITNENEEAFLKELKDKVEAHFKNRKSQNESEGEVRLGDKAEIEDFLNRRFPQLKSFALAVRSLLTAPPKEVKEYFRKLIDLWKTLSNSTSIYKSDPIDHLWLMFGFETILHCLFATPGLDGEDFQIIISSDMLKKLGINAGLDMVRALSKLFPNEEFAESYAYELSKKIDLEDDVSTRSDYYADIAHSLILVNKDEALEYFRKGLRSSDAIGSGDYRFVNELLLFASSLRGKEMAPENFHSLSNICEINMNSEPHKFFWDPYGSAFSKIAGLRGLARLSRWDDRQKIDLSHTLLPSLIPLVRDRKLTPKDAISLSYLASPAEYRSAGTIEFIDALSEAKVSAPEVRELIRQFTLNNSGSPASWRIRSLTSLSEKILGKDAPETVKLNRESLVYHNLNEESNRRLNRHSSLDNEESQARRDKNRQSKEKKLFEEIRDTNPVDKESLKLSQAALMKQESSYDLKEFYFSTLRAKVNYSDRKKYIENLSTLEDDEINWHWIIEELSLCHEKWGSKSLSLKVTFKNAGLDLLRQFSPDLISGDYLSHSSLKTISKFSGLSISELALELVRIGSQHDIIGSGAVWLSIATLLNQRAKDNIGQAALKRLLVREASAMSDLASDGEYNEALYPKCDDNKILAGLIWKALGSHDAESRWRATHSVRSFAKFERWTVINELVKIINQRDSGPFQCEDIKFYDHHARLWLLIAIARISIDYPKKIAAYKKHLVPFLNVNHVLMRHFAASALLECHKADPSFLSQAEMKRALDINKSQKTLTREKRRLNSYQGRPKEAPKAAFEFLLEYDFRKSDVDTLGSAFNVDFWKMEDMIAESAQEIDKDVSRYSDDGNKDLPSRYGHSSKRIQTYGEYVAWHALYKTAGKLLSTHSTTKDDYCENSWNEWLSWRLLSRDDGFWQSDTLDLIPLEIKSHLLVEKEGKLVLSDDREVLLGLANLNSDTPGDIVIDGHWTSEDGIGVEISSALIPKKFSKNAVASLSKIEPFHVWIPELNKDEAGDRFYRGENNNLQPWIVSTEVSRKLDESDPYGADTNRGRSRISRDILEKFSISSADHFQRVWKRKNGKIALKSEIWRGPARDRGSEEYSGIRLLCEADFLKELLKSRNSNLIVLIRLQQYVEERRSSGNFFHSVALVEITDDLSIKYHRGIKDETS